MSFNEPSAYGRVKVEQINNNTYKLKVNATPLCKTPRQGWLKGWHPSWYGNTLANLTPQNGEILYIGLGCGNAPKTIANHNHIEKLDITEINAEVIQAYKQIFDKRYHLTRNKNVKIYHMDGAEIIRRGKIEDKSRFYDSIIRCIIYDRIYTQIMKMHAASDNQPEHCRHSCMRTFISESADFCTTPRYLVSFF